MAVLAITAFGQTPVKSPVSKSPPRAIPAFGTDIQDLIRRLTLRGAVKPKSEFETTQQYEDRADALLEEFDKKYTFVKPYGELDFSYNADDAQMLARVPLSVFAREAWLADPKSPRLVSIALKSIITGERRYAGSNAFGVSRVITARTFDEFGIIFAPDSPTVYGGLIGDLFGKIPMDAARAKTVKPNMRIVLTGRLADSNIHETLTQTGATLDSPTEVKIHQRYLLITLEKCEIVDIRNGAVVMWFGPTGDALPPRP